MTRRVETRPADLLGHLPRTALLSAPTPLEHALALSRELGVTLLFKRDDLSGLGAGGNKLRKLEFIVGRAREAGASLLITTGGPQSNHARLTAAVAARMGMRCHLCLRGAAPAEMAGNLLLDHLFGAEVEFMGDISYEEVDERMDALAHARAAAGERPWIVPLGGATPEGALGYVLAFREILDQCAGAGLAPSHLIVAVGTGSTYAGLLLGAKLWAPSVRILGVSVSWSADKLVGEVLRHVAAAGERARVAAHVESSDVWMTDAYVGPGYSQPSSAGQAALRRVARREGVLLDSTYTAKAMAGAINEIDNAAIPNSATVVFLHTGGTPELFARSLDDLVYD